MLENEELRTVVLRTKNLLIKVLKVTQKFSEAESLYNLFKKCIELLLRHSIYDMQSMFRPANESSAFTFIHKKDILDLFLCKVRNQEYTSKFFNIVS